MRAHVVVMCASVVVASGSGCLTLGPASHARATGAPLVVDPNGTLRQGRAPIDEEDFYSIAGDRGAVQIIRARRSELVATQVMGQVAGASGIGAMGCGGVAMAAGVIMTKESGPLGLAVLLPGIFVLVAGMVATPVGYTTAADAADEMFAYQVPEGRARVAAKRYNGTLRGGGGGGGGSGSDGRRRRD